MTLSVSQMALMSRLLDEALPLDDAGRRRWLESIAAEHASFAEALRRALLPTDTGIGAEELLTLPKLTGHLEVTGTSANGLAPGLLLGPYEIIRPLGSGGMAEVWLARRADGAFQREVALKLPLRTRLRKDLEPRFAREREILASLSHPNIAQLFDAGFSDEGQPYLALEYVIGRTLTDYCDHHRLTLRARLDLFRQTLSAVHYAHTHLVIHRDLKPSNVLVTASGQVRLLDFGIAKLLSEGEAKETELTLLGGRALTPDYAAPEQIAGAPITTAADVYALGVMLYEILTGNRPYRLKRDTRAALEEAILQADALPPSRAALGEAAASARGMTVKKLSKALKGDLDVITLKSLKKSPRERYQTASALDEDIERFLGGAVVLAQPDSIAYRARKFARRHWVAIATASVLILTLTGGLVATSYEARLAAAQRDAALQAQSRLLTQAAGARLKEGDVSGAMNVVLEVLAQQERQGQNPGGDVGDPARLVSPYTPEALRVFQETRAQDAQVQAIIGHEDRVCSAAWSYDGRRIVTGSLDKTARIWDAQTGQELLVLRGHAERVQDARFSPDGQRIATASWDGTARVWDAATGRQLVTLKGHSAHVETVAFSPDGERIVTASQDSTARIWDSRTGAPMAVLRGHRDRVYSAAFSSDGRRIATASADSTARVWDAITARPLAALSGHSDAVYSAAFSPDDHRIVTASGDRTARIWDSSTGVQLLALRGHTDLIISAAFSPDGRMVVTASADTTARLWDAETGQQTKVLTGNKAYVSNAAFSPDGRLIVTASGDRTVRIWDGVSSLQVQELRGHAGALLGTAFSPDGRLIVTASTDNSARIWDAATGLELKRLVGHTDGVSSAEFSPDGKFLLTSSLDKTVRIWAADSGRQVQLLRADAVLAKAAFAPDGRRVVTASYDNTAAIWDSESARRIAMLQGHEDRVEWAAFSPDGTRVVTASDDKTARIWDAATGHQLLLLSGHTDRLETAAFSPDGRRVITSANDNSTRIWDANTGEVIRVLSSNTGTLDYAGFSPDGRRVVTTADDNTARIWDAQTGQLLSVLPGHAARVEMAAFAPDGQRLVTASDDKTARIWDSRTVGLDAQIRWARAAQFEDLTAQERFELGLPVPQQGRPWPRDGTPCDELAAAPYDPDRLRPGVESARIATDLAGQACAEPVQGHSSERRVYQRGRVLQAAGQYDEARAQLEAAVAGGYRSAKVDLARLLLRPSAGMLDAARAESLLEQAWSSGVTIAAYELGRLFEQGVASPSTDGNYLFSPDSPRAWGWYRKGVDVGEPHALSRLAEQDQQVAAQEQSDRKRNAALLDAFELYGAAAAEASRESWPEQESQGWRYRRASLARILARQGMMSEAAAHFPAM